MVKAVNGREFNNVAGFRCSYETTVRRVAIQGLVCSPRVVVIQIRRHKSFEMPLIEHDDVIEKLSAQRPDHSFLLDVLLSRQLYPIGTIPHKYF